MHPAAGFRATSPRNAETRNFGFPRRVSSAIIPGMTQRMIFPMLCSAAAFCLLGCGPSTDMPLMAGNNRAAAGEGRSNTTALVCEAPAAGGWRGASQTLALNRTNSVPITIRGWSRAQDVTGTTDNDHRRLRRQ